MAAENSDTHSGRVPFLVPGHDDIPCETWYQVHGDLHSGSTPLIILHGGAGVPHGYLLPFRDLWTQHQIPVVFYDQIGCGNSTHLPDTRGDKAFWQPSLFVAELENLLEHLGLLKEGDDDGSGYHILGHSWGATLAINFAVRQPRGLKRLILASGTASTELLRKCTAARLKQLPLENQKAVEDAIEKRDFTSQGYKETVGLLFRTFACRARPYPPPELVGPFAALREDDTVNSTMMGDSHFLWNGATEHLTSIPLLPKINVPTLVFHGEFDTAMEVGNLPFFEKIPKVRWVTLQGASHMPWLDSKVLRGRTMGLVARFLMPKKEIPLPVEEGGGDVLLD